MAIVDLITLRADSTKITRILDGICEDNNYQSTIVDAEGNSIPNPETKAQFAKRIVIERIKDMVLAGERKKAEKDIVVNNTALEIT